MNLHDNAINESYIREMHLFIRYLKKSNLLSIATRTVFFCNMSTCTGPVDIHVIKRYLLVAIESFVHLEQSPIGLCGPRVPKQQRPRGMQRPFGRCCCFGPR